MSSSILQIEIPRRCNRCRKCSKTFSQGDFYCSVLANAERHDFCLSCWNETQEQTSACYWKANIPFKKNISPPPQTKQERLVEMLKAANEDNPAEALLLALYLTRKKALIYRRDFIEAGLTYSLYETTAQEEMIAIKKIPFGELDLDGAKQALAEKIGEIT